MFGQIKKNKTDDLNLYSIQQFNQLKFMLKLKIDEIFKLWRILKHD